MQDINRSQSLPEEAELPTSIEIATQPWLDWWQNLNLARKGLPLFLVVIFWLGHIALAGFRGDHFIGGSIFLALYYGGPKTQAWFRFMLPVILYLALYDAQGYIAEAIRGEVRVKEPYLFDEKFFGIDTEEGRLLPSEWLQKHTHPFLDFITGLSYLIFIPVFLAVGIYFRFFLGRKGTPRHSPEEVQLKVSAMMWGMFWLNLICCSTYYWYPAAPPWYVDMYGFGPAILDAPASTAGAGRFDELLGIQLFANFYSRAPNVFGAIPSLHVAFPLLSVYCAFQLKSLRVFCLGFLLLISFAAVYLNHHYIIDLLWGFAYALPVGWLMNRFYPLPLGK